MTTAVVHTILNYKNYDDWSSQIKTYLLGEDLWDITEQGLPKIEDEESKAWKKKDAKALYAIQNSCGDDTYKLIKDETTAKGAWDILSSMLKKPSEPSNEKVYMSVGEVYSTQPPTDDDTRPEVSMEEGRTEGAGHDEIQETFVQHVESNDWNNAINFLRQHPQAGNARIRIQPRGGTALHYAIRKRCSLYIIQQLVELMANEDLEIHDSLHRTALHYLISWSPKMVEVAECMVKKNHNLLTISSKPNKKAPVVVAQGNANGERMAHYLYSLTPPETIKVIDAAQLISNGFRLHRFDIAWNLIQCYPKLAMATDHDGNTPLATLASNRFEFKSGRPLNLWEKLIYYGIRIKPLPHVNKEKHESKQSDQGHLSDQNENQSHHLISTGINRIYMMKLMHERVKQFLPLMCKEAWTRQVRLNSYKRIKLKEALFLAAERGHVEYIAHFFRDSSYSAKDVLNYRNEKSQTLFHIAAECRHHKVYNLIYVLDQICKKENILGPDQSDEICKRVGKTDGFGNNLLHTVASITPLSHIDHIQGAALQMQRELQWFKEVESIANPKHCESVNKDNKTPREVFKENHKELGKEAEKSMKETATSCTVVGALIVTIMFAAAFTVPGENDKNYEKAGLPTFLTNKVFRTFIVSDAISLFSSTTSVIMFLGILTSRYSDEDFYKSLPIKMIIGLFTLFSSIATMMIVFSCGLYIMLDGKSSIVIPSILLASVPVTSFIWMQFPLLVELFISTFGRGVFDRKQKHLF